MKRVSLLAGLLLVGSCATPKPTFLPQSDAPHELTVADILNERGSLNGDAEKYYLTMLSILATHEERAMSLTMTNCPQVQGYMVSGETAYKLLTDGVARDPKLAAMDIGRGFRQVLPPPVCIGADHTARAN